MSEAKYPQGGRRGRQELRSSGSIMSAMRRTSSLIRSFAACCPPPVPSGDACASGAADAFDNVRRCLSEHGWLKLERTGSGIPGFDEGMRLTVRKPSAESFPVALGEPFKLKAHGKNGEVENLRIRYSGIVGKMLYPSDNDLVTVEFSVELQGARPVSLVFYQPEKGMLHTEQVGPYKLEFLDLSSHEATVRVERR